MKPIYFPIFFAVIFSACQKKAINLGMAEPYFPPAQQMLNGVAYKYYEHEKSINKNFHAATNISFRTYQYKHPNILEVCIYDAAFRKKWHTEFITSNNQFIISESTYFSRTDTFPLTVHEPVSFDWSNMEAASSYGITWNDEVYSFFEKNQTSVTDTLIESRNSKFFKSDGMAYSIRSSGDTTKTPFTELNVYAENIGLLASYHITEEMESHTQLVEQFPLDEFRRRANHGKKRMAYIDPKNTLDNNLDFELCNSEIEIGDYYNCDDRGELKGGKGTWWRILEKELDTDLLFNESGYLTYRFVLNCKGEAGRFITEETGLNFRKKEFNEKTVSHLYGIVSKQTDWQICKGLRRDPNATQDAYTYITFKLKDGKVIEILP